MYKMQEGIRGLEESLADGTADEGASDGDGLEDGMVILERRVDLHQVHGDESTGLVDGLADVVTLTESETSTDRGTGGGGDGGVKGIDVEAEVDGAGAAGGDVLDGHLDDLGNTVLVNLVHGEGFDAVLTEDLLLTSVDVTETDVNETVGGEARLHPGKLLELTGDSEQERDRAAVDVSTLGRLGGVNISMGIDPDQTSVGVDRHGARNSAESNRVVTSKGQGKRTLLQVSGNRGSNRLSHGRDKTGVEELANWGVRGRLHQVVVTVAVKLDLPVELLELVKETKLDDLEGTLINTISGLTAREWDANDTDGLLLEELVLDSGHIM